MSAQGRVKAADIADADFLAVVEELSHDRRWGDDHRWVMRWEVEHRFADVPWKVLLAKARKLIGRGLMTGCACGCRGDYSLTDAGLSLLANSEETP